MIRLFQVSVPEVICFQALIRVKNPQKQNLYMKDDLIHWQQQIRLLCRQFHFHEMCKAELFRMFLSQC